MNLRGRSLLLGGLLLVAIALLGTVSLRERSGLGPLHNPTDFVAFYCGAKVAAAGHDPYRSEPLRTCERTAFAESRVPMFPGLVVPAPLPGYTLAFFVPLGLLSFRVAALVWAVVLAGSAIASAALVTRASGAPPALVFACFLGADFYASIVVGQLVPLVVLALCCAGAALAAGRVRVAAACTAAMLVEPHLGLPVCAALFVWQARSRTVLVAAAVLLAALFIGFVGPSATLEYFAWVLPAQARGEGLEFYGQYGLSAALHVVGIAAGPALALGSLSYVLAVIEGVAVARRAAERWSEPARLVYVPVAFALLGGAYVHIYQMAAALPLALVLATRTRSNRRLANVALVCIAIPWQTFFAIPAIVALFPAPPFVDPKPLVAVVGGASRLAEDVWTQWMATAGDRDHRTVLELFVFKLPTWFALATFVAIVLGTSLGRDDQPARNRLAPR